MSKILRLSNNGIKRVFLICAAFIHFWAVLRFLDQLEWLQELGLWQTAGFFSYMLLLALLEALLVWAILVGISLLLPKTWAEDQKVLFLGNFAWISWLALIFAQYLLPNELPTGVVLGVVAALGVLVMAVVQWFTLKRASIGAVQLDLFSRVEVLAVLFLGLDVVSLVVVLLRNIFWLRLT